MANLSSAFGWTMAGSALSTNQLDATCENITNTGHHKWANEGLMPEYIAEPICDQSHSNPNVTIALPWALLYTTEVFATQLLHAFAANNTNASMNYLCDNLRYLLIDGFHMLDARVINATCIAGGTQMNPRPEGALAQINTNITAAYVNAASILYGLMFASSARTNSQLNILCAHAPDYVSSLDAMMLNGTLVQSTICEVTEPMSTDAGVSAIKTWSSRIFTTVVENVSNVSGWLTWLCDNLDEDAMESVGLDGQAVHKQVCSDANAAATSSTTA